MPVATTTPATCAVCKASSTCYIYNLCGQQFQQHLWHKIHKFNGLRYRTTLQSLAPLQPVQPLPLEQPVQLLQLFWSLRLLQPLLSVQSAWQATITTSATCAVCTASSTCNICYLFRLYIFALHYVISAQILTHSVKLFMWFIVTAIYRYFLCDVEQSTRVQWRYSKNELALAHIKLLTAKQTN